jgi:glycerophosphoryl diester phosphodiesterase
LKSEALVPDYLLCDQHLLTENSSQLWRGPWRWAIYDVASRQRAIELAARGVKLIGTTSVREMLRELKMK